MSVWEKLFSKITFKDYPDNTTPVDAINLNKMTDAIDGIDDRVVELKNETDVINTSLENINTDLSTLNSKIQLRTVSTTRVSDTYPSVIQVYLPNAKNKAIFITPGTGNTVNIPYITRIDKADNTINIAFSENLQADTTYYLDLLIISKNA